MKHHWLISSIIVCGAIITHTLQCATATRSVSSRSSSPRNTTVPPSSVKTDPEKSPFVVTTGTGERIAEKGTPGVLNLKEELQQITHEQFLPGGDGSPASTPTSPDSNVHKKRLNPHTIHAKILALIKSNQRKALNKVTHDKKKIRDKGIAFLALTLGSFSVGTGAILGTQASPHFRSQPLNNTYAIRIIKFSCVISGLLLLAWFAQYRADQQYKKLYYKNIRHRQAIKSLTRQAQLSSNQLRALQTEVAQLKLQTTPRGLPANAEGAA